ncbi:MAG: exonuclease [bacterium]|nr:exonuclease [bacterium]
MIRNTYIHLPGIGPVVQRRIRSEGVSSWDDFLSRNSLDAVSLSQKGMYDRLIGIDRAKLGERDERYFTKRLAPGEHWRLFEVFRDDIAYLDIETTGGHYSTSDATVVGVYRGGRFIQLVAGHNLSGDEIDEALAGTKLLVTFSGTSFDVPFLKAHYGWLDFGMPHFDLRFGGKRVGLRGGLKRVETRLGLTREGAEGLDGYDAVKLWRRYEDRNDEAALGKLLKYNEFDVLNLEILAEIIYNRLKKQDI